MASWSAEPGFCGKLPLRGDFVARRLPREFLQPWDDWQQRAIAESQARLGSGWLDVYLNSPLWAFASSPGIFGRPFIGVMMPSVDQVGRYYPLTVAVELPADLQPLVAIASARQWFADVERLMLALLDETLHDLSEFDERVRTLALPQQSLSSTLDFSWTVDSLDPSACHFRVGDPPDLAGLSSMMLSSMLSGLGSPYSLWTTAGARDVDPAVLVCAGLPAAERFPALLDGDWSGHGWSSQTWTGVAPPAPSERVMARSCSVTHAGHVRQVNEDAHACRDDGMAWIVADGVGGHRAGDLASALVVEAVSDLPSPASLDDKVGAIERALRLAQKSLAAVGDRFDEARGAASTVVALVADADEAAMIWAGDSRLYRLRRGVLEQLTNDHTDGRPGASHVITRAVGGGSMLELDVVYTSIAAGDRFLLCTDGLHGELSPGQIEEIVKIPDPKAACDRLRDAVLEGRANDNLTAVIVDFLADRDSPQPVPRVPSA